MSAPEKIDYHFIDARGVERKGSVTRDGVYTVEVAARALNVSRPLIYAWMKKGRLDYVQLDCKSAPRRLKGESVLRLVRPRQLELPLETENV